MIDSDRKLRNWKPTSTDLPPGRYAVTCEGARGLYVRLFDSGSITWIFRYKLHGKARQMALGPYPAVSLAAARDAARKAYADVKAGIDPIEAQRAAELAKVADVARRVTFADYMVEYLADRVDTFKTDKQAKLWQATLKTYALPHIGNLYLNEIDERHIQAILAPIYNEKRETARKVVQRVAAIMAAAIDEGLRDRDKLNPARPDAHANWRKRRNKQRNGTAGRRGNHPAVPVPLAPSWFAALREQEGMGARALEFVALTATRQGEVRAATWSNVDLERRVWTVPAEGSKMSLDPNRVAHQVPLSRAAVALLEGLERREGCDLVFPSPRNKRLSDMTVSAVMRRMQADAVAAGGEGWLDSKTGRPAVPHGLRATFRTWAAERGKVEHEVAEAVLAHAVGGSTSLAYQRGHYFDERITVMQAWADYLTGEDAARGEVDPVAAALELLRASGLSAADIAARLTGENVVPIKGAA